MRVFLISCGLLVLAGCAGSPPDDPVQGVGFGNYGEYLADQQRRDREAELQGGVVRTQTIQPPDPNDPDAIAADAVTAIGGTQTAAVEPDLNNPSISDEQDFGAVSARRSIDADADRLKASRQQYTVIAPSELPRRPGNTAQTPIEFALATRHPVGSKQYRRSGLGAGKVAEKCAGYRSDEQAQDAFLREGGPERDRLGIDPDGDGYACSWNPGIYRGVSNN